MSIKTTRNEHGITQQPPASRAMRAQFDAVAERIRARTEATIVSPAPGITDRITISTA